MLLFAAIADDSIREREVAVDDSLLIGVAQGNRQAFTALYSAAGKAVYAYCLSILKNPQEAEDAMQDTFLRIRAAAGVYEPRGKPMAWIFTISRNICLMKLRQQRNTSVFGLELTEAQSEGDQIADLEDRLVIRTAMRILSEEECRIIFLHAVTGWKHREIARQLGMPLNTVLSKYRRGIRKLKVELEGML